MSMNHDMGPFSLLLSDMITLSNAELNDKQPTMKMAALWDVAPCSLVDAALRSRGAGCLHHQSGHP
jgi:hypothetical protein